MPDEIAGSPDRTHTYHADATVLEGHLHFPLEHVIHPQGFVKIAEQGGYLAQQANAYRLESILSYRAAHTQVAGREEQFKEGEGWNTLVTSVVEGLNILDVVTCDRLVAQISTKHPHEGYVPHVSFVGTHFHNLRIGGHLIKVPLNLEFFGPKPKGDAPYTKEDGFVKRVTTQHEALRKHATPREPGNPLASLLDRFNRVPESFDNPTHTRETVHCSLVESVQGSQDIAGYDPERTFGHVIHVPDFGTVYLAEVCLVHADYHPVTHVPQETHVHLDMIRAELGCAANGSVTAGSGKTNGGTRP